MAQPVDFVGLNTFIYEATAYDPINQLDLSDERYPKVETLTYDTGIATKVFMEQNHIGSLNAPFNSTTITKYEISCSTSTVIPSSLTSNNQRFFVEGKNGSGENVRVVFKWRNTTNVSRKSPITYFLPGVETSAVSEDVILGHLHEAFQLAQANKDINIQSSLNLSLHKLILTDASVTADAFSPPVGVVLSSLDPSNQMPFTASFLEPSTDPLGQFYSNTTFQYSGPGHALPTSASVFPALMLRRNGPYGWPSWRQIRTGENHLIRRQKKHSMFTLLDRPKPKQMDIPKGTHMVLPRYGNIKAFNEPPVTSKYYPLSWNVSNQVELDDGSTFMRPFSIEASLGNETESFVNAGVNNILGLPIGTGNENYNLIKSYYLDGALADLSSPIDEFEFLSYKETIYPKEINTYRAKIRVRKNFTFPWNDSRDNRAQTNVVNYANTIPYQSMWPLDADVDWETRTVPAAIAQMRIGGYAQGDSIGGPGILQNTYSLFTQRGDSGNGYLTASAFYSRPHDVITYIGATTRDFPLVDISASAGRAPLEQKHGDFVLIPFERRFQGQAPWEAGIGAGYHKRTGSALEGFETIFVSRPKQPFYNSYDEYAEEIRGRGKSYTLVPEFRISTHVEDFAKSSNMNDNLDLFEITGGYDLLKTNSSQDGFYTTYSNTDFLKFFELIRDDHDEFVDPAKITLTCKAIKKFLPYEGFYPAQRTAQITQQFWDSYKDNVILQGEGISQFATASEAPYWYPMQALYTPLFAPGVLYNSIKSGIACDYPMYSKTAMQNLSTNGATPNTADFWSGSIVQYTGSGFNVQWFFNNEIRKYDDRYGMETLCFLKGLRGREISLNEPRFCKNGAPDALMEYISYTPMSGTAMWSGLGDDLYIKMVNNFVAEVPNFFLQDERVTTFSSLPQGNPNFGQVKELNVGAGPEQAAGFRITLHDVAELGPFPAQPADGDYISIWFTPPNPTDVSALNHRGPYYIVFDDNYSYYDVVFDMDSYDAGPIAVLKTQQLACNDAAQIGAIETLLNNIPNLKTHYDIVTGSGYVLGEAVKYVEAVAKKVGSYYNVDVIANTTASFSTGSSWAGYGPSAQYYGMRVNLKKSNVSAGATFDLYKGEVSDLNVVDVIAPQAFPESLYATNQNSSSAQATFVMYSRPSAFGPPCIPLSGSDDSESPHHDHLYPGYGSGYNWPYTPPYYYGQAWLDLYWQPTEARKYSLQEIVGNLTASYSRFYRNQRGGSIDNSEIIDKVNRNAMQLSASVIYNGSAEKKILTTEAGEQEIFVDAVDQNHASWIIQPKWETPTLNFAHLTGEAGSSDFTAIASSSYGNAQASRGMWHQYGRLPLSASEGIFLEIQDIPDPWPYITHELSSSVKSLADLVGFPKQQSRIGDIAEEKIVKEAIVAIPYSQKSGKKKFYNIPKNLVAKVLKNKIDASVGPSIVDMVHKMKQYVFPPSMDFVNNPRITPFAMYIFEFKHQFSKLDLADMWQNLPPDLTKSIASAESSISHDILSKELLSSVDSDVKWLVFKVKQRAKTNYYDIIAGKQKVGKRIMDRAVQGRNETTYNWPYDFFSLVELVKLDAQIDFATVEPPEEFVPPPTEPDNMEEIIIPPDPPPKTKTATNSEVSRTPPRGGLPDIFTGANNRGRGGGGRGGGGRGGGGPGGFGGSR